LALTSVLYYTATPPHVPSFPTRRSSDLDPVAPRAGHDRGQDQRQGVDRGEHEDPVLGLVGAEAEHVLQEVQEVEEPDRVAEVDQDRKSTRLNSSHVSISYAVFCLKKKTQ